MALPVGAIPPVAPSLLKSSVSSASHAIERPILLALPLGQFPSVFINNTGSTLSGATDAEPITYMHAPPPARAGQSMTGHGPLPAMETSDSHSRIEPAPIGGGKHSPPSGGGKGRRLAGEMIYHGGAVMHGTVPVHLVWYGAWSSSQKAIVTDLISGASGSPWMGIMRTYYDSVGPAATSLVVGSTVSDTSLTQGSSLDLTKIWNTITGHISGGRLPLSSTAMYAVLTSPSITVADFCTHACGWHSSWTAWSTDIKFMWIGNAATQCPGSCGVRSPSPNGDGGVDAMASVIMHEIAETGSDADPGSFGAWYDADGDENADKCAWTFGSTYTTADGSLANVHWGSRDFLIQQNWVNVVPGFCALSAPTTSPSPTPLPPSTSTSSPLAPSPGSATATASRTPSRSSTPLPTGLASMWCPRYAMLNFSRWGVDCTADDFVPLGDVYTCGPVACPPTYSSFSKGCAFVYNPWGGGYTATFFDRGDGHGWSWYGSGWYAQPALYSMRPFQC